MFVTITQFSRSLKKKKKKRNFSRSFETRFVFNPQHKIPYLELWYIVKAASWKFSVLKVAYTFVKLQRAL